MGGEVGATSERGMVNRRSEVGNGDTELRRVEERADADGDGMGWCMG
jgi:hypothetical protein